MILETFLILGALLGAGLVIATVYKFIVEYLDMDAILEIIKRIFSKEKQNLENAGYRISQGETNLIKNGIEQQTKYLLHSTGGNNLDLSILCGGQKIVKSEITANRGVDRNILTA